MRESSMGVAAVKDTGESTGTGIMVYVGIRNWVMRPYDATALWRWVGRGFDFGFEVRLGRLASHPEVVVGHVDARPAGVEFPAVVDAPQAGFFVAAEEEARPSMRAVVG